MASSKPTLGKACARMKSPLMATRSWCAFDRAAGSNRPREKPMNVVNNPKREHAKRIKPDPIDPRARAYKVVDTDFHFIPDWQVLRKFMKEPFKSELTKYPQVGGDYSPQYAIGIEGSGQETLGRASTAADVLRVMQDIGAGTVVLSPGFQRPQ